MTAKQVDAIVVLLLLAHIVDQRLHPPGVTVIQQITVPAWMPPRKV